MSLDIYENFSKRFQKPYLKFLRGASQAIDYGRELSQGRVDFSISLKMSEITENDESF